MVVLAREQAVLQLPPPLAAVTTRPLRISVIVPATNNPATLLHCCDALIACQDPPEEIVVIDGPGDANAATARNLGADRATGDILLFVDADVEVLPDVMTRIRAAFAADDDLAALFGSYDDDPGAPGVTSAFRNLLHHHVHQAAAGPATTFWTGLGAVRRESFLEVGGFDEAVEYMEDIDLGMRLAEADRPIVLDPEIQGKHLKRWTVWGMMRTDVFGRGVPWMRILLRHRHSSQALNLGWRHRASAFTTFLAVIAVALRNPIAVGLSILALVLLNWSFYRLLLRRRGPFETIAGIGLHALHYVACMISIPIALFLHLRDNHRQQH
jgi:glycosyltransferase involved in cell wall biosynthesis